MKSRYVVRVVLVLIVGGFLLMSGQPPSRNVSASSTVELAKAILSLPTPAKTVLLAAQSAYEIGALVNQATTGTDSVSIKVDIEGDTLKLDLGMTATIPFEMEYRFDDTWATDENVFATIHIVVDDELFYYKRIPEDGFFHDPAPGAPSGGEAGLGGTAKDDSAQGRVTGQIEIGAMEYDPALEAITVTAHANLFRVRGHRRRLESPHARAANFDGYLQSLIFEDGHRIGNPRFLDPRDRNRGRGWLRDRAKPSKATFRVLVWNPYYVELPCSSSGGQGEHGAIFEQCITAHMNYADTPGSVRITTPEPDEALVTLEGFASNCDDATSPDCWSFDVPEREFRMGPIKVEASARKDVKITGQHVQEDHDQGVVPYSTEWALSVKGTNRVTYEKPGSPNTFVIEAYEWGAPFRAEPIQPALLAAPLTQFRVLDVPAKEPFPGWERDVTLDATLTNGCPAAPLGFTKEILIQVEGAPADAESAIITFWDGRQASRGQISTTIGEFTVPSGYHGVLTPELNETIARTIDIQGCTAEFVVEVRPH